MPRRIPTTDPVVIRTAREYRAALIARDEAQVARLAREWIKIEQSLSLEMQLLAIQVRDAKLAGSIITEQLIRRMEHYKKLDAQMKTQILDFAKNTARLDIEAEQLEFGIMALRSSEDIIKLQFAYGVAFDRLPVDHIETYVGLLGDGSQLNKLLVEAYPDSLDGVIKALLEGSARGLNPNTTAFNMARDMGIGLERITLIARTEEQRVNRLVAADQYRASGLGGYQVRVSARAPTTCMACLMADGEKIPLDQVLTDHPNGMCTTIMQVDGAPEVEWEKGQQWFERQSPELQKEMMGTEKFELWQAGGFGLQDLVRTTYNDTWGSNPRVATVAELTQRKDE